MNELKKASKVERKRIQDLLALCKWSYWQCIFIF